MADDLSDSISDNAQAPKEVTVDGVRARQHDLKDQIAADRYLASKQAVQNNPATALVRVKMVPPGTV